ncbi:MAG TPA: PLP-dependent aminotransferase family protein [Chryseolinea sp.]|nr:PLP-dependent aminotransferase family protein [Chryseolinea sp.]
MLPVLKRSSGVPLHEQLYDFYRKGIVSRRLRKNYRLPSVRKSAADLGISNNTVIRAYQQLSDEGFIMGRPKKGLFVQEPASYQIGLTQSQPTGKTRRISTATTRKLISIMPSTINEESFPLHAWRKAQQLALDSLHFQYDHDDSQSGLKDQLVKYLFYSRGVIAKSDQLVFSAGTNQMLSLLAILLQNRYDTLVVEEPGYERARMIFSLFKYKIETIPVNHSGIDISRLKDRKRQLLYITPSHQYPTGAIMPVDNRLRLIQWAEKSGSYIIEDDYESEFRYSSKPIPALQGIDMSGQVIYIGTFSKILLPSLRVAYAVLPERLLESFTPLRYFAYSVPYQVQRALAIFMEKGYWEKHVRRMQKIYKEKYFLTIKNVKKILADKVTVINLDAGLSILIEIRTSLSGPELVERARKHNILMKGAEDTYFDVKNRSRYPRVFVGFGNLDNNAIPVVINALKEAWFGDAGKPS